MARLAMLVAILGLGYSAQAAIRAIIATHPAPLIEQGPATGFEAEDHFPGAALLYAADEGDPPIPGATGTIALPEMPAGTVPQPATLDASIHPAPPFSMRAASANDRARALQCLTAAIYYEAGNEPEAGQRAVAQVILNRVRHPAFPATICGVIYQGSERAGCQFSYACDGSMARTPARASWLRAMGVAAAMLGGTVEPEIGMATHYHTFAVTPAWNRQLVMTAAIGAHFFHRWQGYWGTPAAFTDRYRGGEPLPGPHPRAISPLAPPVIFARAISPATPPRATTAIAAIQPAYRDISTPRPTSAATDALPDSQILDRWKDSGKPLR